MTSGEMSGPNCVLGRLFPQILNLNNEAAQYQDVDSKKALHLYLMKIFAHNSETILDLSQDIVTRDTLEMCAYG